MEFVKVLDLLNKNVASESVFSFVEVLDEPYKKSEHTGCYYYIFERIGVEILFNTEGYLQSLFFHNKGVNLLEKYGIELPYQINILDNRQTIEEKIGIPERQGSPHKEYESFMWTSHPELGLRNTYLSFDKDEYNVPLKTICISQPEEIEDRVNYYNRSTIYSYFQVESSFYNLEILTDLFQINPSRTVESTTGLDINEVGKKSYLWEILLTKNQYAKLNFQLNYILEFLKEKERLILGLHTNCKFQLKFLITNSISSFSEVSLEPAILSFLSELGVSIAFEFLS